MRFMESVLVKNTGKILLFFVLLIATSFKPLQPEEGMYPLAQLHAVDLQKAGLRIPQSDIYQPGKIG